MSDKTWNVDHDGEVFLIYDGPLGGDLYDTALTTGDVLASLGDNPSLWTDAADAASPESVDYSSMLGRVNLADKASEKAIEQLSELNIKVVNLANKLAEHMRERDAHNPAMMYKGKK
jgi:hypothetical protein